MSHRSGSSRTDLRTTALTGSPPGVETRAAAAGRHGPSPEQPPHRGGPMPRLSRPEWL